MKILEVIARILLGLVFVVFGSNAFLHFIKAPPWPQNLASSIYNDHSVHHHGSSFGENSIPQVS
jgi:putative oxidoreductase